MEPATNPLFLLLFIIASLAPEDTPEFIVTSPTEEQPMRWIQTEEGDWLMTDPIERIHLRGAIPTAKIEEGTLTYSIGEEKVTLDMAEILPEDWRQKLETAPVAVVKLGNSDEWMTLRFISKDELQVLMGDHQEFMVFWNESALDDFRRKLGYENSVSRVRPIHQRATER